MNSFENTSGLISASMLEIPELEQIAFPVQKLQPQLQLETPVAVQDEPLQSPLEQLQEGSVYPVLICRKKKKKVTSKVFLKFGMINYFGKDY